MRISWKWLSEFVDLSSIDGPSALAEILTSRGLEVEAIERLDQGFEKVVTAKLLERKPHPQADRLSVCTVSTGQGEPLEIVCGAQNMKSGDTVALAQVGAFLPNQLKIAQSKIRGVVSNGMLCSEEELHLKEKSEGILILPPTTPLGVPLAKILGRDDVILSLKLTANRSDCLSHFGIAREVGAALGRKPKKPETSLVHFDQKSPIQIHLDAGEDAPQFFGVSIEGVKIAPSPDWLVKRLESLGSRSINNVVDATNLVLLELGHPMHAYDADQLSGNHIHVRPARKGEALPLLDGQTIELDGDELVIADGADGPGGRAIGLAGVMGGGNSEVRIETSRLYLECAEFNPSRVRRASTRHQRKTDAAHRFERGIDPAALPFAISRLKDLILQLAGGKVIGANQARQNSRAQSSQLLRRKPIVFGLHYLNDFLGFERDKDPLTLNKVERVLQSIECEVERNEKEWKVTPPSFRLDLSIPEDLAEEIARCLGYDYIPSTIPPLSSTPVFATSSAPRLMMLDRAKDSLSRLGLHEVVNFAFTSRSWLTQFGLSSQVPLLNPLSEEYEMLVPSLIPGLIRNSLDNWNRHFGSEPLAIRLFELRPVFGATEKVQATGQSETGVSERWKLSIALSGPRYQEALRAERGEVDFFDLKAVIQGLMTDLGARGIRFQKLSEPSSGRATMGSEVGALFHPGQSMEVLVGNSVIGYFGLLHPAKARELKVRSTLWLAELDWDALVKSCRSALDVPSFKPWSEFPAIERDFALLVKNEVNVEKICQLALKAGKPLAKTAKIFDIYRGSQVAEGMTSVAVRVIFYDEGRSLQEEEAEVASAQILASWKKELGAELRS